jgi:hypothetical protein
MSDGQTIPVVGKVFCNGIGEPRVIIEETYNPDGGNAGFAVWNEASKKVDYVSSFGDPENESISYVPTEGDLLYKGFISLPSGVTEYGSDLGLICEIKDFIHRYFETSDLNERLLSAWIMLTYVHDKCESMAFINFRGPRGVVKTTGAMVLLSLCYRGMRASGCSSYSTMFRETERWNGTLLINEGDLSRSDESRELTKYINERYQKGGGVWRHNKETKQTEVFTAFAPTIITSRQVFGDDALESRCLTIKCSGLTRKDIPLNLDEDFRKEARQIRNKLLMFRFRNYARFNPKEKVRYEGVNERLNQVLQPIHAIFEMIDPALPSEVISIASEAQESQVDANANSIDGTIVRAFALLKRKEAMNDSPICKSANALSEAALQIGSELSAGRIGKRMAALGFKQKKTKDGNGRDYYMDSSEIWERLATEYIPADERSEYSCEPRKKKVVDLDDPIMLETIAKSKEAFSDR